MDEDAGEFIKAKCHTHVQTLPISRSQTLSATPFKDQVQQYQQAQYRIQRYQEIGYNDDGTKPAWVRLAENKTFKNFSQNVALPLLEGYSYLDGVGELRSFFKGAKEAAATFLGKKEFDALARSGTVDAKVIRFSQNNISANFKNGKDVQSLIDQLKIGEKIDLEPIRIVEKDNMVFTLDNRRLYAYQQAGVEIPYIKLDKIPKKELDKFSTINNGTSIEVREPKTSN